VPTSIPRVFFEPVGAALGPNAPIRMVFIELIIVSHKMIFRWYGTILNEEENDDKKKTLSLMEDPVSMRK
jgi:hypothetical protein